MHGNPQPAEIGRVRFPGHAANVRHVRHFIADLLGQDWPRLDDVLTLVSELASNAVQHTASGDGGYFGVMVAACADGSSVRVQVTDQGAQSAPALSGPGDGPGLLTDGRGLRIVDMIADQWGHDGDQRGRVVWFEVTAKPELGTAPA